MSWLIDEDALESIAIGAGILGTGGGGNPYLGKLRVRALLEQGRQVRVVGVNDLADDAVVVSVGGIGAPTVGIERLPRGDEPVEALRALEAYANVRADAVISVEIGGGNSIVPMIVAAYTGLPVVDADGMGRAFPEVQMTSFFIYDVPCTPAVLCDSHSHTTIFDHIPDPHTLERMARVVTIQMGCTASFAMPVMSGRDVKRTAVQGTLTLVRAVGDAVRRARRRHEDPAAAALQVTGGRIIFQGKIVNVERQTSQGFARGRVQLSGMDSYQDQEMSIDIQNENLIAWQNGCPLVTVPDLICIIDMDSGEPITTELLRYGYRVTVLGIPCDPKMATPQALRFVGPRCFGYDVEYTPLVKRET
jgi:hypothetical protein